MRVTAGVATVLKTFALGVPIGITLIDVRDKWINELKSLLINNVCSTNLEMCRRNSGSLDYIIWDLLIAGLWLRSKSRRALYAASIES